MESEKKTWGENENELLILHQTDKIVMQMVFLEPVSPVFCIDIFNLKCS